VRIHLDTDFGGDTDDAAALAMLLGWPDAELVGITTTADPDGMRAGYVHHLLELAGRIDIPVAAGAGTSMTTGKSMGGLPHHATYWGEAQVVARPSGEGNAARLLAANMEEEATLIAIGPMTNLALLEAHRPGTLRGATVVAMGGWVQRPAAGLPDLGPEMDWNVQCDTQAAIAVFEATDDLTLVTLPATLTAHLRQAHLERLEASGPIGRLLARQARAYAGEHSMSVVGRAHADLPNDLLNFQYDPATCAAALGWRGAARTTMRLRPRLDHGVLSFLPTADGKPVSVVLEVDGTAFPDVWLEAVQRAERRS
jgi:purine nucleosidase